MSFPSNELDHFHQLHPAFAGYLHDGAVSDRDALATIFHLLKTGSLDPIWKDNNMHQGIMAIRLMKREPQFNFEKEILTKIFSSQPIVSTNNIGQLIKKGEIQDIIKRNIKAIAGLKLVENKLKFKLGQRGSYQVSVNGNPIDTVEEANAFRRLLHNWLLPIFFIMSLLLVVMGLILLRNQDLPRATFIAHSSFQTSGDPQQFAVISIFIGVVGIVVCLFNLFTFSMAKKIVSYDFEKEVLPIARKRYAKLFVLLKKFPLQPHSFTNEFLPFAIAFGLDNSWQKEFGLDEEIRVDHSPINRQLQ